MSTNPNSEVGPPGTRASVPGTGIAFDAARPYEVHPQVEIRPEPFGALLYSFKTRRLSFLKDPMLVDVVRSLGDHPSAEAACAAAGVGAPRRRQFDRALGTLLATETIRERTDQESSP